MEAAARAELVAQGRQLKEQLSQLEAILDEAEAELQQEAQKLPNLTHPQVSSGTENAPSTSKFAGKRGSKAFDELWCYRVPKCMTFGPCSAEDSAQPC